jgi:hypothetical protein
MSELSRLTERALRRMSLQITRGGDGKTRLPSEPVEVVPNPQTTRFGNVCFVPDFEGFQGCIHLELC